MYWTNVSEVRDGDMGLAYQRQAKSQLAATVPSREIVGDARQHSGFKSTQQEAHTGGAVDVVDKSSANRANAKAERDGRDEPTGANPLAAHVGGKLKDNIGNVEDGQEEVVVVALEAKVLLKTGQARIAGRKSDHMRRRSRVRGRYPMLARSMKQKRYRSATVGTM